MTSQWGRRSSLFCLRDVIDCRWRWEQSRFPQKYSSFSHLYFTNRETNAASVCFSLRCYVEILPSVFFCIGFPEEKGASKIMSFSVILCVVISCSVFQGGCLAWLGLASPLLSSPAIPLYNGTSLRKAELWALAAWIRRCEYWLVTSVWPTWTSKGGECLLSEVHASSEAT